MSSQKREAVKDEQGEEISDLEEVRFMMEKLVGGKVYEEIERAEDDEGVYLYEIRLSGKEGATEYTYMREGHYQEGQAMDSEMYVVFFNREGEPRSGHAVAEYVDGKWRLVL